jgi:hypothetical protein
LIIHHARPLCGITVASLREAQPWFATTAVSFVPHRALCERTATTILMAMTMTHLHMPHVDHEALVRAENALLLTLVCGGLAACAIGAVIYDLGRVFGAF